jgi:hypothetical protein
LLTSFFTLQDVRIAPRESVSKMAPRLNFLRPYALQPLVTGSASSGCSAYLRFYDLARRRSRAVCQRNKSTKSPYSELLDSGAYNPEERSALMSFRIKELKKENALSYPRLRRYAEPMTISRFRSEYMHKVKDPSQWQTEIVTIGGMFDLFCRHEITRLTRIQAVYAPCHALGANSFSSESSWMAPCFR